MRSHFFDARNLTPPSELPLLWPLDCIYRTRMNIHQTARITIAAALLLGTLSWAQDVKTDYDRGVDFARDKTFSWEKVQTQDPLWVSRIKDAVSASLAAKGWIPVESGGDVAIVALDMTKSHRTLNTYYDGFGGGWGWGGGFGDATTSVNTYKVGTLVVDLYDTGTKQLIWRGSASDTLSDKSDKNIKNLDKGVEKMFDHFPPGEAKH